jgi:hypothetical protein
VKPYTNWVEVHPQLSNNRHPVDGALVGAGSQWLNFSDANAFWDRININFSHPNLITVNVCPSSTDKIEQYTWRKHLHAAWGQLLQLNIQYQVKCVAPHWCQPTKISFKFFWNFLRPSLLHHIFTRANTFSHHCDAYLIWNLTYMPFYHCCWKWKAHPPSSNICATTSVGHIKNNVPVISSTHPIWTWNIGQLTMHISSMAQLYGQSMSIINLY